jgi:hypothetical protein
MLRESLPAALNADSLGFWIRRQRPANGARPRADQMAGPDGNDDDELGRARRSLCARHALAQQQMAVEPRRFVAAHLPSPAYPPMPASNMWLKRLKPTQHSDARPCQSVGVQNNPASAATPRIPNTIHPSLYGKQHPPSPASHHLPHITCLVCLPWFLSAQRAKVCKSISNLSTESRKQMPVHCCG